MPGTVRSEGAPFPVEQPPSHPWGPRRSVRSVAAALTRKTAQIAQRPPGAEHESSLPPRFPRARGFRWRCRRFAHGGPRCRSSTRPARRYGPIFTIRAMPWGTAVVVNDAELVKEVFSGDPAVYHAGEGNSILAPIVGSRSVLVLDEDEHLRARRTLLPPFHGQAVRAYGSVVEEHRGRERSSAGPCSRPSRCTLASAHDHARGDPARRDRGQPIRPAWPRCASCCRPVCRSARRSWPCGRSPSSGASGAGGDFARTLAEANRLLLEEIRDRRRDPKLEERDDVLSRLISAGESDDEELRDQIMTLLVAGHETSSTGLAWTFERLLRHPAALARAREGEDAYLDAVVQESLRVRPVLPVVLRQLCAPGQPRGLRAPRGSHPDAGDHADAREPALFSEPLCSSPSAS